ncbi:MAG: PhoX family phosphatase [Betaproteobacteria bacterium]|nr:PhoX family phosphatase [Betaproteobacteria bacterium]
MPIKDLDALEHSNPCANPGLDEILACDPTRRRLLQGGLGAAGLALFGTPAWGAAARAAGRPAIGFAPVAAAAEDRVRVPAGYTVEVLYAWGDPVSDGPAFRDDAGNTAAEQALQAGMHHDGMAFFPFREGGRPSSRHGLLCVNHEYTDDGLLHGDGMKTWSAEKVAKSQAAHGVSVIEVREEGGRWQVVRPSKYARRITASTPCLLSGPAAGSPLLATAADPRARLALGTLNNCACGQTPWGTYLTCEENFNGYFAAGDEQALDADHKRYGIRPQGYGYRWHEHDERFDAARHPHEPNRFGWVVEIDPWRPDAPPIKRTALGRIKHESATVTLARDGRVVVYMGDDERFEYIYRFVSRHRFDPRDPAANRHLLDEGTLFVARFDEGGEGRWLPLVHGQDGLTPEHGFRDQAEVLVKTRQAADRLGATKMDRPEWIAVHPRSGEVYCTLTHNGRRGGPQRPGPDAANPRPDNVFGHIIRWREAGGDAAAGRLRWEVFVLCGDRASPVAHRRGNIRGDVFGSPDGLWFDAEGRLWIQTDVATSALNRGDYAAFGNNQMLCADTATGEIRRFLTGPHGCEITGALTTPDGRSLFLNIQHPGETGSVRSDPQRPSAVSAWPASQFGPAFGTRPRAATVVIRREDGGVVGG